MSKNKDKTVSTAVSGAEKANAQISATAEDAREGIALLLYLLSRSVPMSPELDSAERKRLENAVFGLVDAVNPQDGLEFMAAAQLAALNLASLDSLGRAANCDSGSRARDLNLRYGIKSTTAFTNLMKAIDGRRRQARNNVSVGSVKVETGGQAIVGNVETGIRRAVQNADESQPTEYVEDDPAIGTKPSKAAA